MVQTQQKKQENSKFLKGVTLGALAGGTVAMFSKGTRSKVKQNVTKTKGTVTKLASDVRENPKETKDEMMERVKEASTVLKEAVDSVQNLYDKANGEIMDQVNDVKQDSQEAVSTAKEAKEDLKTAGKKVKEAKEELVGGSDSQPHSTSSTTTKFRSR